MYKLNRKSATARFYEWMWNTDVSKFKTMCPYFWKYVLTILFSPALLVGKFILYILPAKKQIGKGFEYIAETKVGKTTTKVATKVFEPSKGWDITGKILKWLFFAAVGAVGLLIAIGIIIAFFTNTIKALAVVGGLTLTILAICGIVYVFDEYSLGSKISAPFRLFGNMVYSLYKNVCPMIKWEQIKNTTKPSDQ